MTIMSKPKLYALEKPQHHYRFVAGEGNPSANEKGTIPHEQFNLEAWALNSKGIAASSFTIHVAPRGSRVLNDDGTSAGPSLFGHVFASVKTVYMSGRVEIKSIGFSPGTRTTTNADNLSFNDIHRYPDASTITVEGISILATTGLQWLSKNINDYMSGAKQPPNYNLATNNCIDFVKQILKDSGINGIYLPSTPDGILGMLGNVADNYMTPLIIDLSGDGVHTVGEDSNVSFDFDGTGNKVNTGWSHPEDGFLVLDKNHDGLIDAGEELFGDNSRVHDNKLAADGFEALAYFDANQDKVIDLNDAVWKSLQVWQDKNTDGISQESELFSLDALGISSISLSAKSLGTIDENSNIHHLTSVVQWASGKQTDIVDVLLNQSSNFISSDAPTKMGELAFIEGAAMLVGQSAATNEVSGVFS